MGDYKSLLLVASKYSRDPSRLAQFARCSVLDARRYLHEHGLVPDVRVPRATMQRGASTPVSLYRVIDDLYGRCGDAHRTYQFVNGTNPSQEWRHTFDHQTYSCSLSEYRVAVLEMIARTIPKYQHEIDGVGSETVLTQRLSIEEGWGRGKSTVPWQLVGHPANAKFVERGTNLRSSTIDPDELYERVMAWNYGRGVVLACVRDATVHRAVLPKSNSKSG